MSNNKSCSKCTIKTTDVQLEENDDQCQVVDSRLFRQSCEDASACVADEMEIVTTTVSNVVGGNIPDGSSALNDENSQEGKRVEQVLDGLQEDSHNNERDEAVDRNEGTVTGADGSSSSESERHEKEKNDSDKESEKSNEIDCGESENEGEAARGSDDESLRDPKRRRLISPSRHSPDSLSASEDSEVEAYFECVRLRTSIIESARRGFRHRASLRNYGFRMQRFLDRRRVEVNESSDETEEND